MSDVDYKMKNNEKLVLKILLTIYILQSLRNTQKDFRNYQE